MSQALFETGIRRNITVTTHYGLLRRIENQDGTVDWAEYGTFSTPQGMEAELEQLNCPSEYVPYKYVTTVVRERYEP